MTARVCLLRATLAPTTRLPGSTYSAAWTMKSGPVELFTMTFLFARTSRMSPMMSGGDLRRSNSALSRLASLRSFTSSLSMSFFSPSMSLESWTSLSFLSSRWAILSDNFVKNSCPSSSSKVRPPGRRTPHCPHILCKGYLWVAAWNSKTIGGRVPLGGHAYDPGGSASEMSKISGLPSTRRGTL